MAFRLFDRVKETTTTTGTGTVTLAGAVSGFRTFTSVLSNLDTTWYCIVLGTEWEVGVGTFTTSGTTLARTTVISSSNANALVNFSAGSKEVFITMTGDPDFSYDPTTNTLRLGGTTPVFTLVNTAVGTTPTAPAAGEVSLFSRGVGGRSMPAIVGPSGLDTSLQPFMGRNRVGIYQPVPGLTTLTGLGLTPAATGTATAKTNASTNIYTQTSGVEFLVTPAATTSVAGFRCASAAAQNYIWRGNAAGLGGFFFVCRFGLPTGVSTSSGTDRLYVGLSPLTAAPTDVQPSSLFNLAGVGYDAADTNFQILTNIASGTATKIDTGIAVPTTNGDKIWEIALFAAPNSSSMSYEFTQWTSGGAPTKFSGSTSTNLPVSTTFLSPRGYHSAGGTSTVMGFGLLGLYVETDY